jgi:hypothetical protein
VQKRLLDRYAHDNVALEPPMRSQRALIASLLLVLGSAGCNILLGLDKFEEGSSSAGGGGSGGGTTTTGTTQVCVPGTEIECVYHGPESAKKNAPCHVGTQLCNVDGSAYEPCTGEVLPAATDTCGDGIDDDCNGTADDGCICTAGTKEDCAYGGDPSTQNVGACRASKRTCNADGKAYGACDGSEVLPTTEICGNAVDEDCDGTPDDGCPCAPGTTAACYEGAVGTENVGACHGGLKTCNPDGETYGPCVGQQVPAAKEDCATPASDDDCDGSTLNGCLCVPNDKAPCYDGPPGTENVGVCHGGEKTCNADGQSYGACSNQKLPGIEACSTLGDEDCNGHACSEPVWTQSFQTGQVHFTATDPQGNIFVLGTFNASIMFGATNLITSGSNDVFLAKFDAQGQPLWAKKFGDAANQNSPDGLAVDTSGNVYFAMTLVGSVDFGGGALSPGAQQGFAIAKLGGAGNHLWSKSYLSASAFYCRGLATDPNGDLIVAGDLYGTANLGAGAIVSAGASDVYVAKLAKATGTATWNKRYGDANDQFVRGMAVDGAGNILLTGNHVGTWTFGGPNLVAIATDLYVAKLDGSGNGACSKSLDNGGSPSSLSADPTGAMVITGTFNATINLGGADLVPAGMSDIYLARYTTSCLHSFSKRFGQAGNEWNPRTTVDSNGNIVLGAQTTGPVDFGGGVLNPASAAYDLTLAKFTFSGTHLWSRIFGTAGLDIDAAVAIGKDDAVILAFDGSSNVNLGLGMLPAGVVLASFDP